MKTIFKIVALQRMNRKLFNMSAAFMLGPNQTRIYLFKAKQSKKCGNIANRAVYTVFSKFSTKPSDLALKLCIISKYTTAPTFSTDFKVLLLD
jgi:hypothetical protein